MTHTSGVRKKQQESNFDKQVLIAILNNPRDFLIARDFHWYRIPVRSAPKRWPPDILAFYQTRAFKDEKWAVRYFALVTGIEVMKRIELLPDELSHDRVDEDYYKVKLGDLRKRSKPILSKLPRNFIFTPTTWTKFMAAKEYNDLFDESPLEDKVWRLFLKKEIEAERQYCVGNRENTYFLDFAIFLKNGNLNVECDGDTWHSRKISITRDNKRDNFLVSQGWAVLRFSSNQIHNEPDRCIKRVMETANRYGGIVSPEKSSSRTFETEHSEQLTIW